MRKGFTLVELLVTIGILGVLSTIMLAALIPARRNARDTVRKAELTMMGRYLMSSECYVPAGGPGDYDLKTLFDEVVAANPGFSKAIADVPKDPRLGTATESGYRYAYAQGGHCALYANLENPGAAIDLAGVSAPTPGAGTGALQAASPGPNGTDRYYQIGR